MKIRNLVSNFGQDSVHPISSENRTLGYFSTASLWIGAAVIVTTVYTGMLLVPELPFLTAFSSPSLALLSELFSSYL